MDYVFINQLKVEAIVGLLAHERTTPQTVVIDAKLYPSAGISNIGDNIAATIDYAAVCADISHITQTLQPKLLETLADAICAALFANYPVAQITLSLHKPQAVAACASVGVCTHRSRAG